MEHPDHKTILRTVRIDDMSDAAYLMGQPQPEHGEIETPIVCVPSRSSCSPWLVIPEGFYARVTSFGRAVGVWESGLHAAKPWEVVSHLVTAQATVFDAPVKACPTLDNTMVTIDVSVVFRILKDNVEAFVTKLGPERLQEQLMAYTDEAIRNMVRTKRYTNVYDLMDTEDLPGMPTSSHYAQLAEAAAASASAASTSSADSASSDSAASASAPVLESKETKSVEMTPVASSTDAAEHTTQSTSNQDLVSTKDNMNEKLKAYGVEVLRITITQVRLPRELVTNMEKATTWDSKNRRAAAEQAFTILKTNNEAKQRQARELIGQNAKKRDTEGKQEIAKVQTKLAKFEAETQAMVEKIRQEQAAEMSKIRSDGELAVAKVNKEKEVKLAELLSSAEAEAQQVKADMLSFVNQTRAKMKTDIAPLEAETISVNAQAEYVAATKLKAKREFELKMAKLRILRNLAANKQLVLAGSNRDNVVAQMVAARNSAITFGLNADSKEQN